MSGVASWLCTVTAAALLLGLLRAMMPEGSVKEVSKLTGGLFLFVVLLRPVMGLSYENLVTELQGWKALTEETAQSAASADEPVEAAIIAEESAAYIQREAESLGINCTVIVQCEKNADGLTLPVRVEVAGALTQAQRESLLKLIADGFSLDEKSVNFTEGEGTNEAPDA